MNIFSVILQCFLILAFSFSGTGKIVGMSMQVQVFKHLKLPQWFRVFTGIVQLAGTAGLVVGFWNKGVFPFAALWIACTMLGAIFFHVRVRDPLKQFIAPIILMILSLILALLHITELI